MRSASGLSTCNLERNPAFGLLSGLEDIGSSPAVVVQPLFLVPLPGTTTTPPLCGNWTLD